MGEAMCDKCCWKERCDNPDHFYRPGCPYCRGTGRTPLPSHALALRLACHLSDDPCPLGEG